MARLGRAKVFSLDLANQVSKTFASLNRAKGFSGAAQTRMARDMRVAVHGVLERLITAIPSRTGRSRGNAKARAFGTSFNTIRGHITAQGSVKLLNEGGTIEPQETEFLTIPIYSALRPDGTPKLPSARAWQNIQRTFVWKNPKTGRLYIVYDKGKGKDSKLVFLYALVESADVEGRNFFDKAWNREKRGLGMEFGRAMMAEITRVDLGKLARVQSRGR